MAVPNWINTKQQKEYWEKPWTCPQGGKKGANFRKLCWDHGFCSPNFPRREASGRPRNPLGSDVPDSLRTKCQFHAFGLERVRHDLGDKPMSPDGWYRDPDHNAAVGGARFSEHMEAWATDWFPGTRAALGGERFDQAMERAFSNGGRGYQSFVGGPIRHVDNGDRRTWVYA